MNIVSAIFATLSSIATAVVSWFTEVFGGVTSLIYDSTTSSVTVFGTFLLIGLGISVVWTVLRLIIGLVRRNPA